LPEEPRPTSQGTGQRLPDLKVVATQQRIIDLSLFDLFVRLSEVQKDKILRQFLAIACSAHGQVF
jgi:hypothetical protein